MNDVINYLKIEAASYRSMTTPNQHTITEQAARENERLANQFDMAAEALRQMHNRLFEEGLVAGVKSIVDSCNARRLRKASPASAPECYALVPVEPTEEMMRAMTDPFIPVNGNTRKAFYWAYPRMLAAAPTPPAEERWQPIETAPRYGRELILLLTPSRFPQVSYSNTWWIGGFSVESKPTHWMPLPKAPAMQEDKP